MDSENLNNYLIVSILIQMFCLRYYTLKQLTDIILLSTIVLQVDVNVVTVIFEQSPNNYVRCLRWRNEVLEKVKGSEMLSDVRQVSIFNYYSRWRGALCSTVGFLYKGTNEAFHSDRYCFHRRMTDANIMQRRNMCHDATHSFR